LGGHVLVGAPSLAGGGDEVDDSCSPLCGLGDRRACPEIVVVRVRPYDQQSLSGKIKILHRISTLDAFFSALKAIPEAIEKIIENAVVLGKLILPWAADFLFAIHLEN
jgi:hypothetical protein